MNKEDFEKFLVEIIVDKYKLEPKTDALLAILEISAVYQEPEKEKGRFWDFLLKTVAIIAPIAADKIGKKYGISNTKGEIGENTKSTKST